MRGDLVFCYLSLEGRPEIEAVVDRETFKERGLISPLGWHYSSGETMVRMVRAVRKLQSSTKQYLFPPSSSQPTLHYHLPPSTPQPAHLQYPLYNPKKHPASGISRRK